jgi:hypothetical protein
LYLRLLAVLGLGSQGQAFGATTVQAELVGDFYESVHEEVSVSGAVVVGVAAANALSGAAALAGLVIPAAADRVCMTVLSRDGVYFARNTYLVPNPSPEPSQTEPDSVVILPFDGTRQAELIRGYGPGDLAVRTTPGDCKVATKTYLIARRQADFASVDVLINGFGANAVFYRTADGADGSCEEFIEGRRTSYDYRCVIPTAAFGKGPQQLFIERERYGRPLGQVDIELQLHDAP